MEQIRPTTGIALDTLHPKVSGLIPLKLRVISERRHRDYAIRIETRAGDIIDSLSPGDLYHIFPQKRKKSKKEVDKKDLKLTYADKKIYKELAILLADKEKFANEIITELKDNFSFEAFSDRFTGKKKASDPGNVFLMYAETIKELQLNDQLGTASSYDLSLKSLKAFLKDSTGKEPEKLYFNDITVNWLKKYETYMISDKTILLDDGKIKTDADGNIMTKPGLTRTTVGIYLRPLRALFNSAIESNQIDQSIYPFGKKRYVIPKGQKVKKALTKDQLKLLFNAIAPTQEQEKARDFWFFSYTCNGMNIKDICFLRNENIEPESLNFLREKTKRTSNDQHAVIVTLTDYGKSIIEKYRNPDTNPKAYVFPILHQSDSELTKRKKVQAFTRLINQHIKKMAGAVGITTDISTYFARHSWATLAIQNGASIEYVSEGLSHSDIKTTKGYFAGFADNTKKQMQEKLMSF